MSRQVDLGQIVPNIQVGTTTTGLPSTPASVENVGTDLNPIFNFTIPKGNTGATPNIQIGDVQTGDTSEVTRTGTDENPILNFTLEKGDTGNGIASITKTATSGLVDTYTITFTNGQTTTYEITNGANGDVVDVQVDGTSVVDNGIANIVGISEIKQELEDMYNLLPKVQGTGETITLDGTVAGKMLVDLKGNTSQNTNIITYTCLGTESGDYYFVYDSTNYQFTMPTISVNDVLAFNTDTLKLYLGSTEITTTTDNTGTLITMHSTPNPDYPQDIHVVKGNNTITISNSDNTQSQSYPINLGNIELCKIGDYQDTIVKDNGKWYLNKQINKRIFNGTENWVFRVMGGISRFDLSGMGSVGGSAQNNPILCNYFLSKYANEDNVTYLSSTIGAMSIMSNNFSDLATFKNWLSNGNVMVYYALRTPTYTEITDTTLLSQLETVKRSFNEQTNITQTNDDLPFILNVTALKELAQ